MLDWLAGKRGARGAAPLVIGVGEVLWDQLPTGARMGGAPANFAFHAGALGARAVVVSRVGADLLGARALRQLARAGLDPAYVQLDRLHPTGTVDVKLVGSLPRYRIARNVAWDHLVWTPELKALATSADAICFGTLAQRSPLSGEVVRRFVETSRHRCLRIFDVNLRRPLPTAAVIEASLAPANVLKLNRFEVLTTARLLGYTGSKRRAEICEWLLRRHSLAAVVATLGEHGSEVYTNDGCLSSAAPSVRAIDTVGAGDAFSAALTLMYMRGRDWSRAAEFANAVGAFVASRPGAMPSLPRRLREMLR